MLAAPLFLSNDLRSIEPEIVQILQNRDVIAVDQDELGIQGRRFSVVNNIQVRNCHQYYSIFSIAGVFFSKLYSSNGNFLVCYFINVLLVHI